MNLTPESAKRLADALLDSNPGEHRDESIAIGRLSPGSFGRYRITRLVGVGGMGEVYEAEQESPARKVAIKVVRPDLLSGDVLRRFEHETRILGRLQHPGIAPIYEAGRVQTAAGSTPFFAMEYVDGKPLTGYAQESKLPLRERLELFLKVCDAVEHAHRKGVIHRDLKPGNILVGADGRPRVMDFGVARATDSDVRATTMHTELGRLVGTLPYMSPEQVGGDPDALDTRSDVYSLGVVLYELLGEKLPYQLKGDGRGRIPEAVRAIQESEPAPLSSVDKVFRGDLDTIVAKALAKERGERYQSVGELAADIRRYLADEPIVARRPSAWYQVRKFARRNKGTTVVAVVALAVMVMATGVSAWSAWRELLASKEARAAAHEATVARAVAETKQHEAEKERIISDAVVKFIQRSLAAASPDQHGKGILVVDALDAASKSVSEMLSSQPEAGARVRYTLAHVFQELGEPERAVRELEAGRKQLQDAGLQDDEQDLEMKVRIGESMLTLGNYSGAERLGQEVCQFAVATLGEKNRTTIGAKNLVARSYVMRKNWGKALPILKDAWALSSEAYGEDDPNTLSLLSGYCSSLVQMQRFSEAEPLVRRLVERASAVLGAKATLALNAKATLGELLGDSGRDEEALPILTEVLEDRTRVQGETHPQTLESMNGLALLLLHMGRNEDGIAMLRKDVELSAKRYGKGHPHYLIALGNLGAWLARTGQMNEGIQILQRVYTKQCEAQGATSPAAITALNNTVYLLVLNKEFERARPLAEQLVRDASAGLGDDWRVDLIHATYGKCLIGLKQYEQAEQQLLQAWRDTTRRSGPVSSQAQARVRDLVGLYDEWGKRDEAAKFRAMQAKDTHAVER